MTAFVFSRLGCNEQRTAQLRYNGHVYIAPSGRIWFATRTTGLVLLGNGRVGAYSSDRRWIFIAANGAMAEDGDDSLYRRDYRPIARLPCF